MALGIWLCLILAPGMLIVEAMFGRDSTRPMPVEGMLYALGAGYALLAVLMLALSYLPGGMQAWEVVAAYAGAGALLLAIIWRRAGTRPEETAPAGVACSDDFSGNPPNAFPDAALHGRALRWVTAGVALLLLLAGFLRLTSLGYAEFHGDEARAALRAAAVIQGYEDVLFLHRKGPGEILVTTAVFALTGRLDEASARLLFSMASLATVVAVGLLGWRMAGPAAGWTAALLLAMDGYFVGFARFVQYQSVVVLLSVLSVLVAYRLYRHPKAALRYLILASFFLAGGLLYHYDTFLAFLPATFLLAAATWEKRIDRRKLMYGLIAAGLVGGALVALFYIPYIIHPNFTANFSYLWRTRIHSGGELFYNNLDSFFLRTAIYSSIYYILLLIGLTLTALGLAYWRGLPSPWRQAAILFAIGSVAASLWRTDWLRVGQTDFAFAPFLLALMLAALLPDLRVSERTLWLWFAAPFVAALFLIGEPDTHVHIFFVPWLLVIGMAVQAIWDGFHRRWGMRMAGVLATGAVAAAVAVFGTHSYFLFVYHQQEILLHRSENWPAFYWLPARAAEIDAFYGFPLRNGWKAVGALYVQGVLAGDYESNQTFDWIPAWYTRGQNRCDDTASWYFAIDYLEPWNERADAVADRVKASGFRPWAVVEHLGQPRLVIYGRENAPPAPAEQLELAPYAARFDAAVTPYFPLDFPVIEPHPTHRLDANLDNRILLEGYDLDYATPLRPGDIFHLTLYWRALAPIEESLKVFNQAFYGDGTMVVQQDSMPACNRRPTVGWQPGELTVDRRTLEVAEDAPAGIYPLYTGMYREETMERLPVLDAAGNVQGGEVLLDQLMIEK